MKAAKSVTKRSARRTSKSPAPQRKKSGDSQEISITNQGGLQASKKSGKGSNVPKVKSATGANTAFRVGEYLAFIDVRKSNEDRFDSFAIGKVRTFAQIFDVALL